jgi:hypothetical protein
MSRVVFGSCLLMSSSLLACSGDGGDKDSGTETCEPNLNFVDGNNYSFESEFVIGSIAVAPESDLTIDWSAVTTDIRGRSVVPAEVEQLLAVRFLLPQSEILEKIDGSALDAADSDLQYLLFNSGVDSASITEFSIIGNPFDVAGLSVSDEQTWLLSMANVVGSRFDFLMNTFIVPTEGETNTTVALTNSSATLNFDVDLGSAEPLLASTTGPTVLDWSGVTTDAYGQPLDLSLVNNLVIGHVADEDITNVEGVFLRLYDEADQVYDLSVNSLTSADLSLAVSRADGTPFPGFTADGTWVVAIECVRQECTNPAPLLLAVVEVCE